MDHHCVLVHKHTHTTTTTKNKLKNERLFWPISSYLYLKLGQKPISIIINKNIKSWNMANAVPMLLPRYNSGEKTQKTYSWGIREGGGGRLIISFDALFFLCAVDISSSQHQSVSFHCQSQIPKGGQPEVVFCHPGTQK